MQAVKTYMIECSRGKRSSDTSKKDRDNAQWTSNVDFNLEVGDSINLENSIIHTIGEEESTIELDGETGDLVDNIIGIKFINYVNDNGYNTLKLPYVGMSNFLQNNFLPYEVQYDVLTIGDGDLGGPWYVGDTFSFEIESSYTGIVKAITDANTPHRLQITGSFYWFDWLNSNAANTSGAGLFIDGVITGQKIGIMEIGKSTTYPEPDIDILPVTQFQSIGTIIKQNVSGKEMAVSYGEPLNTEGYNFKFSFLENVTDKPQITAPNNIYTAFGSYPTQEDHQAEHSVTGMNYIKLSTSYKGPYRTNNSSIKDQDFKDASFTVEPMYSEIIINVPAPSYESPQVVTNTMNEQLHTTFAQDEGTIPKNQKGQVYPHVSGPLNSIINCNGSSENFWGELAVKDLNCWKAIHISMRMDLAFEGKFDYSASEADYTSPRPCIMVDGTKNMCKLYDKTDVVETCVFPNYRFPFKFTVTKEASGDTYTHTFDAKYSTLPKYYLITTNIKYNELNVNRFVDYFIKPNEIYDGTETDTDASQKDKENWRFMMDIGSSRDGMNTTNTRSDNDDYKLAGWYYRFLSLGIPDLPPTTPDWPPDGTNSTSLAYGIPLDPYDAGSKIPELQKDICTPRSDFVRRSTFYLREDDKLTITDIETDVPQRFGDSLAKGCKMALFSRQLDDFNTKAKQSNTTETDTLEWTEGDGGNRVNILLNGLDNSLNSEYGIYGINMLKEDAGAEEYYELSPGEKTSNPDKTGSFWRASYQDVGSSVQQQTEEFIYQIRDSESSEDQYTYGGYTLLQFNNNFGMDIITDIYIYSSRNVDYKTGHETNIAAAQFDGSAYVFDPSDPTHILFYLASNKMWLGLIQDDEGSNYKKIKILYNDSFPSDEKNYPPFRYYEDEATKVQRNIKQLYILTSPPSQTSAFSTNLNEITNGSFQSNNKNITLEREDTEKCCAFLLYDDSATKNGDGTWTISEKYPLPVLYHSQFIGKSPSFMDNEACWMVNSQSSDASLIDGSENMQKFCNIGANDPTITFDESISKVVFQNLHTQRRLGIQECPRDDSKEGNIDTADLGSEIIKLNDKAFNYQKFDNLELNTLHDNMQFKKPLNTGLSTSVSGLFIDSIYGQNTSVVTTDQKTSDMTLIDTSNFDGTLLQKLGFKYSDLFVEYGRSYNYYTESLKGAVNLTDRYKQVKPLTTNAFFDIASQPEFSVQDSSLTKEVGKGLPRYQLNLPPSDEFNIDGSTSTQIRATNFPEKIESPYYHVYSDIINTEYIKNKNTMNIVGIIPKNYISGDYVYGFSSSYQIPVLFPQKLSEVNIQIRTPDGQLAPINTQSSIIFKVQRPITYGNIPEIEQGIIKELKKDGNKLQ